MIIIPYKIAHFVQNTIVGGFQDPRFPFSQPQMKSISGKARRVIPLFWKENRFCQSEMKALFRESSLAVRSEVRVLLTSALLTEWCLISGCVLHGEATTPSRSKREHYCSQDSRNQVGPSNKVIASKIKEKASPNNNGKRTISFSWKCWLICQALSFTLRWRARWHHHIIWK